MTASATLWRLSSDAYCYSELDRTTTCEGDTALPMELLYLLFFFGGVYFLWSRYDEWSGKRAERKRLERERRADSGDDPI